MIDHEKDEIRAWPPERIDEIAVQVQKLLTLIGLDLTQPDLADTPLRVARMYNEVFAGVAGNTVSNITVFPNDQGYKSMVVIRDVPFYSMCAHHIIPFFGVGHIGYLPGATIAGLSKFARVLDYFARRPQVQERLTEQVADFLVEALNPRGVMVILEARHLCMEMRGVEKPGSLTITSTVRGLFAEPGTGAEYRDEFMYHAGRTGSVPR